MIQKSVNTVQNKLNRPIKYQIFVLTFADQFRSVHYYLYQKKHWAYLILIVRIPLT